MIAFARNFVIEARAEQRKRDATNYSLNYKPFQNPDPPNVRYCRLSALRKCVTHGCAAHVCMAEDCKDCGCRTVLLRAWRRAVDAGEITR